MNTVCRSIGNRPLSLIPHLRATIDLLLDERVDYDWTDAARCNAGLLARVILGYSYHEMKTTIRTSDWHGGLWGESVEMCPHNPDEKYPAVLQRLLDAGLEKEDMRHIEHCGHPELVHPSWRTNFSYTNPSTWVRGVNGTEEPAYQTPKWIAWYLANWADTIEAFHARRAEQQDRSTSMVIASSSSNPILELVR